MTQKVIKDNLAAYLDIKADKLCEEIKAKNLPRGDSISQQLEVRKHIKTIQDLLTADGRCFAFSIADAAYGATGYGLWWKTILKNVANWNRDPKLLDLSIDLRPLLPSDHIPDLNSLQPEPLEVLFERVLNTIVIEHALVKDPIRLFMQKGQTQLNFLGENENYFEIMINKQIHRIQKRDMIGGFFTTEHLAAILQEHKEKIVGNICLVHAEDHAMNIKYENNQWIVYDPNYQHDEVDHMTKSFDTEEELILEIKKRMYTESLAFQLATLKPDQDVSFSFYEKLTPQDAIELIKQEGLQALARRVPQGFKKVLELANISPAVEAVLVESLCHQNQSRWSGLLVTARYNSKGLQDLLELAGKRPAIASALAKSLPLANQDQWNGLHMMLHFSSTSTFELFEMAMKNKELRDSIFASLDVPNKKGVTPREFIADNPALLTMVAVLESLPKHGKPTVFGNSLNTSKNRVLTAPQGAKPKRSGKSG